MDENQPKSDKPSIPISRVAMPSGPPLALRWRNRLLLFFNTAHWRDLASSAMRVAFALGIALVLCQFPFDYIESFLYDIRMRAKPVSETSGHVQTVAIDPTTVDTLKRTPSALDHIKLLEQLRDAGVHTIVYLINPSEVVGPLEDLEKFAATAASLPHFYIGINDVWPTSQDAEHRLPPPFDKLKPYCAPRTSDLRLAAKDDVTRRTIVSFQNELLLHPIVASTFNPDALHEEKIRGLFKFFESDQVFIDFKPSHTYPVTSFSEAMQGRFPREKFAGNIVIVGRDVQATVEDYIRTPFSRDAIAMSLLEMHANMIDTLILNSAYIRAPGWIDILLTCLISVLTVYLVLAVKPTLGLRILVVTIFIFSLTSFLAFWWGRLWIGMAHPFLSIFICYYFFIPYRLIMENRRSWEYLQKNRLLTQVEELKTNFLSMMSHDLKTPIARIQGMTEVVLKDPTPLSSRQREALLTLGKSSEELLTFVSSILNLGRIESKELKLHKESKDPNHLLEEVVSKYEYLAHQKQISVITEFEPLFSMKMDVDLMRQVFSNLVENAIKYSPEGSKVLISTEELNGQVIIQIADQGLGIPEDEIGHVFMKFYRSKNAKSSTIKGSGLGLYLAKYFVELHKGRIFADSAVGQGSTFTVVLPEHSAEEASGSV